MRRRARFLFILVAFGLAGTIVVFTLWPSTIHNSIGFYCGLLAKATDQYLDGSSNFFQRGSWHLGNSTRTWGETYGLKLGRAYLTLEIKHVNLNQTPEAANE